MPSSGPSSPASRLRRATAVVAAAVLAGWLLMSGGSPRTLNSFVVEQSIAKSILDQYHLYAVVGCPQHVAIKRGSRFACTANFNVGSYPVDVTQIDAHGNVTWAGRGALVALNMDRVRLAIARSIRQQRNLHSTVDCPRQVLQRAGLSFTCAATVSGHRYPFAVTEVDGLGHVRYLGQ